MTEKTLEKALIRAVEKQGGLCLKFWQVSVKGFPDRIILLPGGRIKFIEVKGPGKKPNRLQAYRIEQLKNLGFDAGYINSKDEIF